MSDSKPGFNCQAGCWALAAGVGFVAFVMLLVVGSTGWIGSIFLGGLAYTSGVFFYLKKSLRYHHAIWHGFVLLGQRT